MAPVAFSTGMVKVALVTPVGLAGGCPAPRHQAGIQGRLSAVDVIDRVDNVPGVGDGVIGEPALPGALPAEVDAHRAVVHRTVVRERVVLEADGHWPELEDQIVAGGVEVLRRRSEKRPR